MIANLAEEASDTILDMSGRRKSKRKLSGSFIRSSFSSVTRTGSTSVRKLSALTPSLSGILRKKKRGSGDYDPTPIHISQKAAALDLRKGHIPVFQNESHAVLRSEYPEGLADCKYARCVDQHHIIFSLAEGMSSALLMVVDAISDMYFGLQLFTSENYLGIELGWRIAYVGLCSLGIFGWVFIAAVKAIRYHQYYLHTSLKKANFPTRLVHYVGLFMVIPLQRDVFALTFFSSLRSICSICPRTCLQSEDDSSSLQL